MGFDVKRGGGTTSFLRRPRLWFPIPTTLLLGGATRLGLAKGNVPHKIGIRFGVRVEVGVGSGVEVGPGVRIRGMTVGRESIFGWDVR